MAINELFVKRVPLYASAEVVENDIGHLFKKIATELNLGEFYWDLLSISDSRIRIGHRNLDRIVDTVGVLMFAREGAAEEMARQKVEVNYWMNEGGVKVEKVRTLKFRANRVNGFLVSSANCDGKYVGCRYEIGERLDGEILFWENFENFHFGFRPHDAWKLEQERLVNGVGKEASVESIAKISDVFETNETSRRIVLEPRAKFGDNVYQRSEIVEVKSPIDCVVIDVSSGERRQLMVTALKEIKPEHLDVPVCSFRCRLEGIEELDIRGKDRFKRWSESIGRKEGTVTIKQRLEDIYIVELEVEGNQKQLEFKLMLQLP